MSSNDVGEAGAAGAAVHIVAGTDAGGGRYHCVPLGEQLPAGTPANVRRALRDITYAMCREVLLNATICFTDVNTGAGGVGTTYVLSVPPVPVHALTDFFRLGDDASEDGDRTTPEGEGVSDDSDDDSDDDDDDEPGDAKHFADVSDDALDTCDEDGEEDDDEATS